VPALDAKNKSHQEGSASMPIPDFQSLMLPLLHHFADGEEHAKQETLEALAGVMQLTAAERLQ
jgi:restriction endonuclease Mrr